MKVLKDTKEWDYAWFRKLPANYKLFWIFLWDNCDLAGVWEPDLELFKLKLGLEVEENEIRSLLGEQIVFGAKKWRIRDFIEFQQNCQPTELNAGKPPHKKIIAQIRKNIELFEEIDINYQNKGDLI